MDKIGFDELLRTHLKNVPPGNGAWNFVHSGELLKAISADLGRELTLDEWREVGEAYHNSLTSPSTD